MGMKIFPLEVEEVLNKFSLIKESLVKAKPHEYLNEVPHAIIVLHDKKSKPTDNELITFCGKYLATYKIPRSYECVNSLPKTGSGKIKKW
jgi:acyl-CoA synthetase (AMP-forming)/AMP-acid ligase II